MTRDLSLSLILLLVCFVVQLPQLLHDMRIAERMRRNYARFILALVLVALGGKVWGASPVYVNGGSVTTTSSTNAIHYTPSSDANVVLVISTCAVYTSGSQTDAVSSCQWNSTNMVLGGNIDSANNVNFGNVTYYIYVGSPGGVAHDFTLNFVATNFVKATMVWAEYSGGNSSTPFINAVTATTVFNSISTNITVSYTNSLIMDFVGTSGSGTYTPPSGFSIRQTQGLSASGKILIADSNGATLLAGIKTVSQSTTNSSGFFGVVLGELVAASPALPSPTPTATPTLAASPTPTVTATYELNFGTRFVYPKMFLFYSGNGS